MQFLKGLTITIALAAATANADMPATHGMLIFGDKVTYASHLPMFHHPHDYQVVMKVALADSGAQLAVKSYETAKAAGETLFTIEPARMDLTKVMSGELKSFQAKIYKGHFERGGTSLGQVIVTVEKFIVNVKLNPASPEKNEFTIFGEQGEYFAAHLINGKPSFDTVMKTKQPFTLTETSCRTRVCADPVITPLADSQLPVTVLFLGNAKLPAAGQQLGTLGTPLADITQVIYAEEAELAH